MEKLIRLSTDFTSEIWGGNLMGAWGTGLYSQI